MSCISFKFQESTGHFNRQPSICKFPPLSAESITPPSEYYTNISNMFSVAGMLGNGPKDLRYSFKLMRHRWGKYDGSNLAKWQNGVGYWALDCTGDSRKRLTRIWSNQSVHLIWICLVTVASPHLDLAIHTIHCWLKIQAQLSVYGSVLSYHQAMVHLFTACLALVST